ncbi:MAG TPA: ABC transporter substrate-binding protein, partial [Pararhizobium sp.]|nr:ABC transporter substrate-binding protein [Pararhizobium sp.]
MKPFKFLAVAAATFLFAASAFAAEKKPVEMEIGYMPILPVSQIFVMLENDSLEKAGIEPKLVEFQNGPAMVQALLSGQLDIAYFGIGPAMVARSKGQPIKVLASAIVNQISFLTIGDLAKFSGGKVDSTTFKRFREKTGHKAKITTFPRGSVPDTVLNYWLTKVVKADPSDLEIIHQGAAQVQQALLTGAVDGAAILEPIVSVTLARRPEAKVVASGSEMFPHQPGATLAVREKTIKAHPDIVRALVKAHLKATKELADGDPAAIKAVQKYVGGGRLPLKTIKAAVERSSKNFIADPHYIIEGTRLMHAFQVKQGTLKGKLDVNDLFD